MPEPPDRPRPAGRSARVLATRARVARALVAALGGGALLAAGTVPGAPAPAARAADGVSVDRVLHDARIGESSGLVASSAHPGVLWTHNDSGNPPLLYALGRDGRTLATVRVAGAADVDWEALAPARGRDGERLLAVADIGDNTASRTHVEVDVVAEPDPLRTVRESPRRILRLRYPEGSVDAETLLVDPRTQRMFVVTKGLLGGAVYVVPADAWPGGRSTPRTVSAVLQRVGEVPLSLVTDGSVLPDGRVLLRTYSTLAVLPAFPTTPRASGGRLSPLASLALPQQRQGEGLAVPDPAAGVIALSSEGTGEPVLRMVLPASFRTAGAPATAGTTAGGTTAGGTTAGGTTAGGTTAGGTTAGGTSGDGATTAPGSAGQQSPAAAPGSSGSSRGLVLGLLALLVVGAGVGAGAGRARRR